MTKGSITRGQGTSKIDTHPENENDLNITATVEIDGLPVGCYRVASETYTVIVDYFDPILMYEVSSSKLDPDLELCGNTAKDPRYAAIIKELEENPTNQAYIIFSHKPDTALDDAEVCERRVIQVLTDAGIDRSRITSRRRSDEQEIVQFWRVPPGRENPKCEECEPLHKVRETENCPAIDIVGPGGNVVPGQPARFTVNVDVKHYGELPYEWSVSQGTIIEGKGTPSIVVDTDGVKNGELVLTVKVGDLSYGCPSEISKTFGIEKRVGTVVPFHRFTNLDFSEMLPRLDQLATALKADNTKVGYVISYFSDQRRKDLVEKRLLQIADHLVRVNKLPRDRFVPVSSENRREQVVLYIIPLSENIIPLAKN